METLRLETQPFFFFILFCADTLISVCVYWASMLVVSNVPYNNSCLVFAAIYTEGCTTV